MELAALHRRNSETAPSHEHQSWLFRNAWWLLIVLFSICYFGRTLLRASGKAFWYDEICTLYIVRLPTFADSWAAVLHGADYNPPMFYFIHRAFLPIFGQGQLALRLPEILSFWIFCVCLFRFVAKRAGVAAGWIAMALPMASGAYYYATEARPHGLILGFLGVALVCWQELQDRPSQWGWRIGFVLSLGAAYFSHCYAVLLAIPFGLAELWYAVHHKTIRWREWITLVVPPVAAVISFVPLVRSYRAVLQSSGFGTRFAAKVSDIPEFYGMVLGPCWLLVTVAIVLFATRRRGAANGRPARISPLELILLACLAALPVFGAGIAFVMHGPIFPRYMLGATAGCILLVALACASSRYPRAAKAIGVLLGLFLLGHLAETVRLRHKGVVDAMTEPSADWHFSRYPALPLEPFAEPIAESGDQPLVVHSTLDFLYLFHYGSPELRKRLYSVAVDTREVPFRLNKAVRECCAPAMNVEQQVDSFLATHHDFELLGVRDDLTFMGKLFTHPGVTITSYRVEENAHFLAHVHVATP